MRYRIERQVNLAVDAAPRPRSRFEASRMTRTAGPPTPIVPPELSARDYVVLLLDVGAEIEHSLMVQYLYSAYSLGGPQVPEPERDRVRGWQEVVLGIAKEEMGHLLTVENILRLLGGPLNLDREDFPWDSQFFPFPFTLEKFSPVSIAKYVYAESPKGWAGTEAEEIKTIAQQGAGADPLHRVEELYRRVLELLRDPNVILDSDLRPDTYPLQASWDEWGRGYRRGARGDVMERAVRGTPDVIVRPVASRDDAVAALTAIARQGEAPELGTDDEARSHFLRFLGLYRELAATSGFDPARPVPTNPYVDLTLNPDASPPTRSGTPITHPEATGWAHLFNLRYRMLLAYLAHTFTTSGGLPGAPDPAPRGLLIHAAFGEMYNLRTLAGFLVQTPLAASGGTGVAGPPFEMPYTLALPEDDTDTWRGHRDMLEAAATLIEALIPIVPPERKRYLDALRTTDEGLRKVIERLLRDRRGTRVWR
jgi:hypothetical protein